MRYEYSSHKTIERAEDALYHAYAAGDISEGERPKIERRHTGSRFHNRSRWVITLVDHSDYSGASV